MAGVIWEAVNLAQETLDSEESMHVHIRESPSPRLSEVSALMTIAFGHQPWLAGGLEMEKGGGGLSQAPEASTKTPG